MTADEADPIRAARRALGEQRFETAARIAAQILHANPDNLDGLEIKALVEIERGDDLDAEQSLRAAIALAPNRRWPYADLTRLLLKLGRDEEAESVARDALAADPRNADAHFMLGSLLGERGMLVPAASCFQQAIDLVGPHPNLQLGLGRTLLRQGRFKEARPLLEAAAAADPAALEPIVYLAELEEKLGRLDVAFGLLDTAERAATARGTDLMLQRSHLLERMGKFESALALIEAQHELSGTALLQRGRLRDRLGRHEEAWSDWMAGKSLIARQAQRNYAAGDVERQAETLARFFTKERVAALPRAATRNDVPQPIFILGFPRSGTTLLEQILGCHSDIRSGGELPFGGDLRDLAASLAGGEQAFPSGLADLSEKDSDWPGKLRDFYLAKAESYGLTSPGAAYFTDKMPLNEMWLPLLRIAFPKSPVILVRRHPLDVLISVMAHDMTHGFNCAYRLEDAARHLALVDDLVAQYRSNGIEVTHELCYERLVGDQLGETRQLMASIGLPLEPGQLRFHERTTVSPTPSYAQVQEPLNDRSIGRWRNHYSELKSVEPIIAQALMRGGYSD